jgi:hypothetical protein
MARTQEQEFVVVLTRIIRLSFSIASIAAVAFALSVLARKILPSVAAPEWFGEILERFGLTYLIVFGFLYLPSLINYRWHIRRAMRWAEKHVEPGTTFASSAEYKMHRLAPYFFLAVCIFAFLLFVPLCLGDLSKGTYECRTIPEHISHALHR